MNCVILKLLQSPFSAKFKQTRDLPPNIVGVAQEELIMQVNWKSWEVEGRQQSHLGRGTEGKGILATVRNSRHSPKNYTQAMRLRFFAILGKGIRRKRREKF